MEFDDNMNGQDMEKAYNESFNEVEENSLIEATVIDVSGDTVFLDFGGKSEAKIATTEFGDSRPKAGDVVTVYLIKQEGADGDPIVSKKKADSIMEKKEVYDLLKNRKCAEGIVKEANKNGFIIQYKNLKGFISFRKFDLNKIENPQQYIGKKVGFYVDRVFDDTDSNGKNPKFKRTEDFSGNRIGFILHERDQKRKEFLDNTNEGDIVEGVVRGIKNFGAFIDLGGIEALLPIRDISYAHIDKVEDVLKVGDKVTVKILKIKREEGKVSVGMKQALPDPWTQFIEKYKVGDVVKGKVATLTTFGAFITVMDGVEGLLHISDMSWTKNIKSPAELLSKGQQVEVMIIGIDNEAKRFNLSLKHLMSNPWDEAAKKYKVGTTVQCKVKDIVSFGVFVELEDGIDALLHRDDISWNNDVGDLHAKYKAGDKIEAVVIQFDEAHNKIKVGVKQLSGDPWLSASSKCKKGEPVEVTVQAIDPERGVIVAIVENVTTLIPFSQLGIGRIDEIKSTVKDDFKPGDKVKALVLDFDMAKRFVKLSIREYMKKEEFSKIEQYMDNGGNDNASYTIGDALKSKEEENK